MARIMTWAGWLDLEAPDVSAWTLEGLGAALHRIRRWHALDAPEWSVCQHSLLVYEVLRGSHDTTTLLGLLHDAHEAITGDIPQPVKGMLGPRIHRLQRRLDRAILRRFAPDLLPAWREGTAARTIAHADQIAAQAENACLFPDYAIFPGAAPRFGADCVSRVMDTASPTEYFAHVALKLGARA